MSRHSKRTEKEKSASYLFIERQTARMREALRAENSSIRSFVTVERPACRPIAFPSERVFVQGSGERREKPLGESLHS
jgi:hypothetical protein